MGFIHKGFLRPPNRACRGWVTQPLQHPMGRHEYMPTWLATQTTDSRWFPLELAENTHENFHEILIVHFSGCPLIDVSGTDVQKELLLVSDETLFHLSQ